MKKKLTHNLFLKILSIVFAFMLWLMVVIMNDPYKTVIITGVPITIINEEEITEQGIGQIYSIVSPQNKTVSIKVYGQRSKVDKLKAKDIKATVDFGEISSVGAVYIDVTEPSEVTVLSKSPEMMKISVEALEEKNFDVELRLIGEPVDGYVINSSRISPNITKVTAPESVMQKVVKAVVEVDVNGISGDINQSAKVVLYDASGKVINYDKNDNISLSSSSVQVYAETFMVKEAGINIRQSGTLSENYRLMDMTVEPETVRLKGRAEDLTSVSEIFVPGSSGLLNLTNITESCNIVIDVSNFLPEGVYFAQEGDNLVTVSLVIEPILEKTYEVTTADIQILNLAEDMEFAWVDNEAVAEVTVKGLKADLDSLTLTELSPYINLTGYGVGNHRCTVRFWTPSGVTVQNTASVELVIQEKPAPAITEPEITEPEVTEPEGNIQ